MFGDEPREKGAIHPPRDIVPRGDRQESARVVVEADTIVEARGLGNALAEAAHPFGAVVEPPRRTDPKRGLMARPRRQLARIAVLVERDEDDREAGLRSVAPEHRGERGDITGRHRSVGTLVAAAMLMPLRGMVG